MYEIISHGVQIKYIMTIEKLAVNEIGNHLLPTMMVHNMVPHLTS